MKNKTIKWLFSILTLGLIIVTFSFTIALFRSNSLRFISIYFANRFGHVSSYASLSFFICVLLRNFLEVSVIALALCVIILSTAVGEMLEVMHNIGENHLLNISDFLFRFLGTIIGSAMFIIGTKIYKSRIQK